MFTNILNKCGIYTKTQHQAVSKTLEQAEKDYQALVKAHEALHTDYSNKRTEYNKLHDDHAELLKAHDDLKLKEEKNFTELETMTKRVIEEQAKAIDAQELLSKAGFALESLKQQFDALWEDKVQSLLEQIKH